MSRKLHRVLDEIQKTEEKISVWQEQLKNLNVQREILENDEIIKSIRSMKLERRELLDVLEGLQNGKVVIRDNREAVECPDGKSSGENRSRTEETDSTETGADAEGAVSGNREMESEDLNNEMES